MSRVALVFPHFRTKASTEMLFPPLGLASLAAQLRQRGIETRIFDCTFQDFSTVSQALIDYRPDIVGLSSMILLSRNTFKFARLVGERLPRALTVAGGPMPTLYPEQYSGHFDLVFRGEADVSFPSFCQDYFSHALGRQSLDRLDLSTYPGLYAHSQKLLVENHCVHHSVQEINRFPIPYRGDFDHEAYQHTWLEKDGSRTTSIMITLGCPYDCDFCSRPVYGRVYRKRNLDRVFEEISQIQSLGYDCLWIADDNFTLDISYLRLFCQHMVGKGVQWSCLSRTTGINDEIANMMMEAGCHKVYLGLETGSDATLRLMHKRATVEDGIRAVHNFKQAGMQVAGFFIVGYPGETTSSIEETFQFALSLPLDDISFNVPFPLPGSALFKRVSGLDPTRDWNQENEATFIYTSEFDPRWIEGRIEQTMQEFAEKKLLSSVVISQPLFNLHKEPIRAFFE